MKLLLVDGAGPFFRHCRRRRINWSKIPFESLEQGDCIDREKFRQVRDDFRVLAAKAAEFGFNGVTLDDLAHLSFQPDYPSALNHLVNSYRRAYAELFEIAEHSGLNVFLTTDVMYYPTDAERPARTGIRDVTTALRRALEDVFQTFPGLRGVILRIGECDGADVKGRFRSRLVIKQARQARRLIQSLLPLFRDRDRLLIFRTWTVGAHGIGDLIWNRYTFDRVFSGIESPHLVVSMKYGESDFFRYMPLNKLFFRSRHRKIVELQARREYEGSGQYPSFVGWDYEQYLRQLQGATNVVGAWIWIQTGGWSVFRRLTFLDKSAVWNELNAYVCLRLVRDRISTEAAIEAYCRDYLGRSDWQKLSVLLRLSDEVVKELLYLDQMARRKLFFRRVRVPPLLSVFWDQIIVNHSMRKLMRCLADDPEEAVVQGGSALRKIDGMATVAEDLGLPTEDLAFQRDTFEILAAAREYYFGDFGPEIVNRLEELRRSYRRKYVSRYSIRLDFSPFQFSRRRIGMLLGLWTRQKRGYRIIDRILMIRMLSWLSPVFLFTRHKTNADLLHRRAMGINTVLDRPG